MSAVLNWLRALSPRERAGLAALAALFAIYAAITMWDRAINASLEAQDAAARLAIVEAQHARLSAPEYQTRIAADARRVSRWTMTAASETAEQAQAVAMIEELALTARLDNASVAALESEASAAEINAVLVRLDAAFEWQRFILLLEALRDSETSIAIRSLEVDPAGATLSAVFAAPFARERAR